MPARPKTKPAPVELPGSYPKEAQLRDGRSCSLRPMTADDRDLLLAFARSLPADDLLFLRTNITEPAVVDDWLANIAGGRTITILAFEAGAVLGYGSLHRNTASWTRHVGEIRLIVGSAARGTGLGRVLATEIYSIATALGLTKLSAQMTLDQAGARVTFERLGFRPEALLADWVVDANGLTRDLLMMTYDLTGHTDTVDG